jgi:hypothetical protein
MRCTAVLHLICCIVDLVSKGVFWMMSDRDKRIKAVVEAATDIAHLLSLLNEAKEIVREVEWVRVYADDKVWFECPYCERDKGLGHAPDCRLALWLKQVGGGE